MNPKTIRILTSLAVIVFIGTAFAEFGTAKYLPESARLAKEEGVGLPIYAFMLSGLMGIGAILAAPAAYVGCLLVKKWGAYLLALHMVLFLLSNLLSGLQVYTSITDTLFLIYACLIGMILALMFSGTQPTNANPRPKEAASPLPLPIQSSPPQESPNSMS